MRKMRAGSTPGCGGGAHDHAGSAGVGGGQLAGSCGMRGRRWLWEASRTDPASNVLEPTVLTDMRPGFQRPPGGDLRARPPHRPCEGRGGGGSDGPTRLPYGLSASVWTRDRARGVAVARRLRAGAVCVNDALVHFGVPGLPFGGVGESGFGRSHGVEGLREMTRTPERAGGPPGLWNGNPGGFPIPAAPRGCSGLRSSSA